MHISHSKHSKQNAFQFQTLPFGFCCNKLSCFELCFVVWLKPQFCTVLGPIGIIFMSAWCSVFGIKWCYLYLYAQLYLYLYANQSEMIFVKCLTPAPLTFNTNCHWQKWSPLSHPPTPIALWRKELALSVTSREESLLRTTSDLNWGDIMLAIKLRGKFLYYQ